MNSGLNVEHGHDSTRGSLIVLVMVTLALSRKLCFLLDFTGPRREVIVTRQTIADT